MTPDELTKVLETMSRDPRLSKAQAGRLYVASAIVASEPDAADAALRAHDLRFGD